MATLQTYDVYVRHQIGLQRLATDTVRKIAKHLATVQADIAAQVAKDLTRMPQRGAVLSAKHADRLKGLESGIADALAEAHSVLRNDLQGDLFEAALYETDWMARFYEDGIGIRTTLERPSAALLRSVVLSRPFQGAVLRDWTAKMQRSQLDRIKQQIRIGITEGESIDEIVTRLRGTGALKFRDGQFARDRRGAEALVRTAVNHTVNRAHEALIEPHKRDFPSYVWSSVLDGRTTKICQARAGQVYKTGDGPLPPAHWNCRSSVRYVSRWEEKPEDGPAYDEWLGRQSAAAQDDILGKTGGRLFRDGGLSVRQFTDRAGTALTLEELRRQETEAWTQAFGTASR
jgi:SPP1 gp7 family putative phage head morphogenesis protein